MCLGKRNPAKRQFTEKQLRVRRRARVAHVSSLFLLFSILYILYIDLSTRTHVCMPPPSQVRVAPGGSYTLYYITLGD